MAGLQNNKGLSKLGGSSSGLPKLGSSPMSGLPKLGSLSSKKVELPKLKLGAAAVPSSKKNPAIGATLVDEEANTAENTVDALLDALGIAEADSFDAEEAETLVVSRSSLDLVESKLGHEGEDAFDAAEAHEGTMVTPPPKFDVQPMPGGLSVSAPGVRKPERPQGGDAFSAMQSEDVLLQTLPEISSKQLSGEAPSLSALGTSKPMIAPLPSVAHVSPVAAPSVPVMAPPVAPVASPSVPVMAPPVAPVAAAQTADVQVSSAQDVAREPQPKQSIPEMTVAEVVASAELPSVQGPPMMSEEEQFEAILASMSPEERAAYEAHEAEEADLAALREAEKMREIRELYGKPSDISMQRKFPVGLVIALVVILGGIGFLMYKVMTTETPVDESKMQVAAVQEEVMPEQNRAAPLNRYSVKLKVSGATTLFINGVETPISGEHYFVTGHKNTIMAFGDGMVPFFKTYDSKELVAGTIQVKLEPAVLYQKGIVNFRLSKDMTGIRATFDGRRLGSFPTSVQDVVLGRPHVLVLEKDGYARHMHLIWPDADETNVVIPDLVTEYNALSGTVCSLKPFPVSAIKYGVKITYEGTSYDAPVVPTLAHGDIIEYYITREQRRPLMFAVIPDGFGTLSVDATLLRDSIGETLVTFRRAPNSNVQPCLRRYGEVLCPQVGVETSVPSGPDWEIFGMVGDGDDVRVLRGSQIQRLSSASRYTFDVSQDSRGTFDLKITQALKIKQPRK